MQFNPYGGMPALVAAALVNLGPADADTLVAVMRSHGMAITHLTNRQAKDVTAWADRLREVFAATDRDHQIEMINALLADSTCQPYVHQHDGLPPHVHYASQDDDRARRVFAFTAGGLAHLFCEDPNRIGQCDRAGCEVVYVDTSRNGRKRFCSTRCATRTHVAAHRDRRRVGPDNHDFSNNADTLDVAG